MSTFCKYYKQQKQVSHDSGQTWSDVVPPEYRKGDLYEEESADCQDALLTRWIAIPGEFLCDGKNKYEREIGQYSLNNGETWEFYYPSVYRLGKLLEENSEICNNKWEGYYYLGGDGCPSGYRFVEGRGCVAVGGGGGGGSLNHRYIDPVKYIRCSSTTSTTLTQSDVAYSPYTLYEGYIGDCVTSIGTQAFYQCRSLENIDIPSGVTSIGNYAFFECSSLTNIVIPGSVTSIGNSAFEDCTGLTSCTIGSGVEIIGYNAFYGCSGLTSIDIPNSVTSIDDSAFYQCYGLTSCTIGSGVENIGYDAFRDCTGLTSIKILATTPPTVSGYSFRNTVCPIYVPAESVDTYKSASGWSTYASRIQAIP